MYEKPLKTMTSTIRRFIVPRVIFITLKKDIITRPFRNFIYKHSNVNKTSELVNFNPVIFKNIIRHKSKKNEDHSDEEDDYSGDSSLSKDSKVVKLNTTSMRTDLILKSTLGVARNKIETLFYESKIRINGKKVLKKSTSVKPGDEIDVIKLVSPKNSDHIYVSRVEILNVTAKEESIIVTARRFKHLLIENYENDPFKDTGESES